MRQYLMLVGLAIMFCVAISSKHTAQDNRYCPDSESFKSFSKDPPEVGDYLLIIYFKEYTDDGLFYLDGKINEAVFKIADKDGKRLILPPPKLNGKNQSQEALISRIKALSDGTGFRIQLPRVSIKAAKQIVAKVREIANDYCSENAVSPVLEIRIVDKKGTIVVEG